MFNLLKEYKSKALQLDFQDPLKNFRESFSLPKNPNKIYLCSNSLGLPTKSTFSKIEEHLNYWAEFGAEGWFNNTSNWYNFFDLFLEKPLAGLLGAESNEVIVMNSLTVNLHLLLFSFYRPTNTRFKILIDSPTFPSDLYAIKSHICRCGFNSDEALIILKPRCGEHLLRYEDIEATIFEEGEAIALVFLNNVNFLTGQVLNIESIVDLVKSKGCLMGCDIAHASGNVILQLHKWKVDFAVGCSYKYLCGGPGGPGIAYVHSSHHDKKFNRLSGWWGNDPKTRFQMQLQSEFIPFTGAYSWQVSTPSILSMIPLASSLKIFQSVGINSLREKSKLQTAFLLELLDLAPSSFFEIITPRESCFRGSQLSLIVKKNCEELLNKLEEKEVICDFRPPNIIRVSPSPLYNTFSEIYEFVYRFFSLLKE